MPKKNSRPKKTAAGISKNILIGELIEKYPAAAEVLHKHGFHCLGCMVSPYESLAAGAKVHGIAIEPLVKEINRQLGKVKK